MRRQLVCSKIYPIDFQALNPESNPALEFCRESVLKDKDCYSEELSCDRVRRTIEYYVEVITRLNNRRI